MKKILAGLTVLALAGSANAAEADFTTLDADQSGSISYEELTVLTPDLTMEAYAALDTDSDGNLSEEEFAAYAETLVQ